MTIARRRTRTTPTGISVAPLGYKILARYAYQTKQGGMLVFLLFTYSQEQMGTHIVLVLKSHRSLISLNLCDNITRLDLVA